MIANALVMPTERPPTIREVKRALLSFDTVHLISPNDRELIPPNTYSTVSTGIPPIFGIPSGPVRPLGKIDGFDEKFEQMAEEATSAIQQEIVKIKAAPEYKRGVTIGAAPIPEGVPNPALTFRAYRSLIANPEMLAAISQGVDGLPISLENLDVLAPSGAEDKKVQLYVDGQDAQTPFPTGAAFPGFVITEDERAIVTRLCHARLGSLAKNLLVCHDDDLIPFTSDIGVASVIQALDSNTSCRRSAIMGHF